MYDKRKVAKTYRKFVTGTMALVFVAAGVATATFSFSWFTNKNNITNSNLTGKTLGAYFARGNGTSTDPYVINKPIHLYNLAWLQYIGYFKEETYFIIESDLDMSGWILPPIGTTDHPFISHLDGYDTTYSKTSQSGPITIKNLTVSNSFEDFSARHPSSVTASTFETPNITGLFGVVGDTSSSIEPTIQNLYLDKVTVESKTDNVLTGIVAGYVNGKLDNICLSNSSLDVKEGTNRLTGYDNISKYTSVGYCESKYQTEAAKYKTTMYEPAYVGDASFNPSGGGGDGGDWGSSIDMMTLNRRMNYITARSTLKTYGSYNRLSVVSDDFHYYAATSSAANEPYWGNTSTTFWYVNDGTILPLSIDTETAFAGQETTNKVNIEKTSSTSSAPNSISIHTTNFYLTHDSEDDLITKNNSGYLVGGGGSNDTSISTSGYMGNIRTRLQLISSGLSNSFDSNVTKYDGSKIKIYTLDTRKTDGSVSLITTSNAETDYGYKKYSDVKTNFDSMMSGKEVVHGFHMVQVDETNSSNYVKYDGAFIRNKKYDNYEFLKSALNFNVANSGYISTLIDTCYGTNQNQSLFDLFKIERDESNNISAITRIEKIYKSDIGSDQYSYNSGSDENLLFDFSKVTNTNSNKFPINTAYYYEIPVNKGDYAIAKSKSTDSLMAYLMYLDIGANSGGGDTGTKVQRTKIYEVLEQINEAFTYPTGISIVSFDNAVLDTKTLCITLGSTYSGVASIKRTSKTAADIIVTAATITGLYYFDPELTVTNNSQTIADSELVKGEETTAKTRRLTYLDYYKETEITYMYAFEQTLESDSTTWSDITLGEYASGEGDTDFSSTSGLTIYSDDGQSITTSDITIEEPTDYGSGTVFSLTLKENKPDDFSINYLPVGSINETTYKFTVSGYKFTLNDVTKYSVTSRNESYSLNINGTDIS